MPDTDTTEVVQNDWWEKKDGVVLPTQEVINITVMDMPDGVKRFSIMYPSGERILMDFPSGAAKELARLLTNETEESKRRKRLAELPLTSQGKGVLP